MSDGENGILGTLKYELLYGAIALTANLVLKAANSVFGGFLFFFFFNGIPFQLVL